MPQPATAQKRSVCTNGADDCSRTSSAPTRHRKPSRSTAASSRRPPRRRDRLTAADPLPLTRHLSHLTNAERVQRRSAAPGHRCACRRGRARRRGRRHSSCCSTFAARARRALRSNSVGIVDPGSGRLRGDVAVGATPTHIAVGEGAYWITDADADTVSRIDPATSAVIQTISVGNSPSGITTGNGAVWVANSLDGTVWRIDPKTNKVVQKIDVGNGPLGVVYAAGSVWVANTGDGTISRIDADTGRTTEWTGGRRNRSRRRRRIALGERASREPGCADRPVERRRAADRRRRRPDRHRLRQRRRLGGQQPRRDRVAHRSEHELGRARRFRLSATARPTSPSTGTASG